MEKTPPEGVSIPMSEYHHGRNWGPLLSSGKFRPFYDSPATFRRPLPGGLLRDPMRLGAVDAAVIEAVCTGEDPAEAVQTLPSWEFQSAVDKRRWFLYQESLGLTPAKLRDEIISNISNHLRATGKEPCTPDEYESALDKAHSVLNNPHALDLIDGAVHERSYCANGRKARPDLLAENLLPDFKVSGVDFHRWHYHARKLRYPAQMAWYESVLAECGRFVDTWLWVVIEAKPYRMSRDGTRRRHRVHVVVAEQAAREQAMTRLDLALSRYYRCLKNDEWPDHYQELERLYPDQEDY